MKHQTLFKQHNLKMASVAIYNWRFKGKELFNHLITLYQFTVTLIMLTGQCSCCSNAKEELFSWHGPELVVINQAK